MHLTDTVSQYSSLENLSRNGTDLDLALSLGDEDGIERVLCVMIQDIFLCIKHPGIRAYFSDRLLNGQAREWVVPATIPSQATKDRPELH